MVCLTRGGRDHRGLLDEALWSGRVGAVGGHGLAPP